MTSSRKGLKRIGMAAYEISGPLGTIIIRRNGRGCYFVTRPGQLSSPKFFTWTERTLKRAREWAEWQAGL